MDLKSQVRKPQKSHLLQRPLKLLSVDNFLIMVSLGIFLVWILKYINLDFWYDELFSLDHFVLVPFWNIPTDYSYPNNHIFFNILNKIYLRGFSIRDINILMDTPYVIRSLMLMYTLGVFIVLYQIAVLIYNRRVAVLSLIILMTTVPFYNFSVQVRGYILSTLLVLLLLYFVWRYDRIPSRMIAILLVVSSSLLLYTIPSNLYFVLSILIIQGSLGLFAVVKKTYRGMKIREITQLFFGSTKIYICFLLFLSVMVAVALYSPVLSRVIDNRFVASSGSFASKTILSLLPTITDQFISLRYLFIPLALLGLISSIKNDIRQADKSLGYITQGLLLLVIPFLLSAFRGDKPFDRIFIPLSVVFALTLGALIYSSLAVIASRKPFHNVLMVVFLIYCQVAFVSAIQNRNNRLIEDIYAGNKSQNIFYNYFQEYYAPLAVFGTLANEVRNDGNPRICHYADGDTVVTRYYFSKYHLESKRADTWAIMEDCLQEKSYVMTAFPNKFISFVEENNSKYTCSQISDLYFQTLFKCD